MTRKRYSELNRPARMRKVAASLLGSAASLTLLVVIYYTAPLDRGLNTGTLIIFGLGLLGFVGVITWQMRAISRSPLPRLRAIQAFATGFPLLLLLYAATYILIGHNQPDSFSEELSRTDSLYFTVTVFATVGFGDITPRTELARLVVMSQMLFGLIAFGLVARLLLGAVQVADRRQETEEPETPSTPRAADRGLLNTRRRSPLADEETVTGRRDDSPARQDPHPQEAPDVPTPARGSCTRNTPLPSTGWSARRPVAGACLARRRRSPRGRRCRSPGARSGRDEWAGW